MNTRYGTHLCGSLYDADDRCEHLLYVTAPYTIRNNRPLKQFYAYCTANGHCRSLGGAASFTGNSPTWCPKRKSAANESTSPVSGK